MNKGYYTWLD